jgi:bifunctional enzyme CysN/CysC
MDNQQEQMNIVIVGHVDHGKSTVIGRMLADTGSLPEGKLEQVRLNCERNAKPFEYAFLLDALKDEQAQGITIDTARCFFKTAKRHYIIIDAPGHIEFLKNMISGAARAEAALLVIDAKEGIRENSRRHGFMLSMLGVKQIVVLVNKMDLVHYSQTVYDQVVAEFAAFLAQIGVEPQAFVPISARDGDNLAFRSANLPWYQGPSVLELMDGFRKEKDQAEQPFRFPVQDIYKFTAGGDDRRIFAGTVETGVIRTGDEVIFMPSGKRSTIRSIEGFNQPVRNEVGPGQATGFTLTTQIYVKPGEILCRGGESLPHQGGTFRANLFWMGKHPLIKEKKYQLKLATSRATVTLQQITKVLNSADLTAETDRNQVERHEVAECILKTAKPIAFDNSRDIEATGRFVIVDNYEIVGGGIITEAFADAGTLAAHELSRREFAWERTAVSQAEREDRYKQQAKFIVIAGGDGQFQKQVARTLEVELFRDGYSVYYLGMANLLSGLGADVKSRADERDEQIRRLGELAHIFTDAGQILITNIPELDEYEIDTLRTLNTPNEILVFDLDGQIVAANQPVQPLSGSARTVEQAVSQMKAILRDRAILIEYFI